jgi:DNA-binding CsgD family transcriptional regulator
MSELPLSAKEHEVVRMLASGMTVSEIANHFQRSVSTISKQKNMAMHRLGISTDVELFPTPATAECRPRRSAYELSRYSRGECP